MTRRLASLRGGIVSFAITATILCLAWLDAAAAPQKIRVDDPAVAKALLARGGKLIADYGGFQFIALDDSQLTGKEGSHAQVDADADFIELHAARLDTRTAAVQAKRLALGAFIGKKLHLVQFAGPVKPEWRDALESTGARIVDYIPNNAYLIYGDATTLAKVQAWGNANAVVQWDGSYADAYKVHPVARTNYMTKGGRHALTPDGYTVQLVNDAAANAATRAVIDAMKLGPVIRETAVLDYVNISVPLSADRLDELSAQPDIISILPYYRPHKLDERQDQIIAGNLTNVFYRYSTNVTSGGVTNVVALSNAVPSGPGYLAWLASKGFTNTQFTNFVVDVADSGIDNGTTTPGHFAFFTLGNTNLGSRVAYSRYASGTTSGTSTLAGTDGHGNLNAHIIAGCDDMANGFPHTDTNGFHYGLGVCPFVKVGASVVFDPNTFIMTNYSITVHRAFTNGARISNNSWGGGYFGVYNSDSQTYDALVRNPSTTSTNLGMTFVFAAGNDGPDVSTVTSPGTAKNVIVVGAAENVFSFAITNGGNDAAGNDGCATPDTDANNANDVSYSSSAGPCNDGRLKPDIMAPGTHITGGVPQQGAATTNGTGTALAAFDASGVCGLVGSGTSQRQRHQHGLSLLPAGAAILDHLHRHQPRRACRLRRVRVAPPVFHQSRPHQPQSRLDQGLPHECQPLHGRRQCCRRHLALTISGHGRSQPREHF
ncbi:MAG: S8 family serine peptidase [Verrucomicrobia bacterium]|nr:S8 family serine peptidase [Verrucomicrobiota bacterium]